MEENRIRVKVGRNLLHDWKSRGLLHNWAEEHDFTFQEHHNRSWIEGSPEFIRGLIFDAEHQIETFMEPSPSTVRTNRKFIDEATEALT